MRRAAFLFGISAVLIALPALAQAEPSPTGNGTCCGKNTAQVTVPPADAIAPVMNALRPEIEIQAKALETSLRSLDLKPIDDDAIKLAEEKIRKAFQTEKEFIEGIYEHHKRDEKRVARRVRALKNLEKRMLRTLANLKEQRKVVQLTPEVRQKLNLDEYLCKQEGGNTDAKEAAKSGSCKEMSGFYVPLANMIFVDSTDPSKIARILFHELVHAHQFTYRLPLDLAALKAQGIKDSELIDYQSFYYETQANWYTIKYGGPKDWDQEFRSKKQHKWRLRGKVLVHLLSAGTLGWASEAADGVSDPVLDIDRNNSDKGLIDAGSTSWSSAMSSSELMLIDGSGKTLNLLRDEDFAFHNKYGKAVERAYGLPYLNGPHRKLHNNYYEKLGLSETVEEDPACQALMARVQNEGSSPLAQWLTLPKSEIQKCGTYSATSDESVRDGYAKIFTRGPQAKETPFELLFPDGSEGSRPDLKVVPAMHFLPQLEVKPEKKK